MINLSKLLFFSLCLHLCPCHPVSYGQGGWLSGGGDLVICDGYAEPLDLHEGRFEGESEGEGEGEYEFDAALINQNTEKFFEAILTILEQLDPELTYQIRVMRKSFIINTYEAPAELDDEGEFFLQDGCKKVQILEQRPMNPFGGEFKIFRELILHPTLWDKLSIAHQNVFWLHEVIYYIGKGFGHTTSENTRKLVRTILAREFSQLSRQNFKRKKIEIGF